MRATLEVFAEIKMQSGIWPSRSMAAAAGC